MAYPHSRTSKWILAFGCILSFLIAAFNVSLFFEVGTSVSHLTGDLTIFAIQFHTVNFKTVFLLPVLHALLGFLLGAGTAGFVFHHPQFEISLPYGRSIFLIGGLLFLTHFLLPERPILGTILAAFACGFQNALAARFRGMVLRTTHVTGLLTDLGVALGVLIRGHSIQPRKIWVPLVLVTSFMSGALVGSIGVFVLERSHILVLAVAYFITGISWSLLKRTCFTKDLGHS